eukprot:scaffold56150_cov49-Phaeocystis_antarctica.AAC.4
MREEGRVVVGAGGQLDGRGAQRRVAARWACGVGLLALAQCGRRELRGDRGVGHGRERGEVGDVDPGGLAVALVRRRGRHGEDVGVRLRVAACLVAQRHGRQRRRRGGRGLGHVGEGGRREPVRHAAECGGVGEGGRPHRGHWRWLGEGLGGLSGARRALAQEVVRSRLVGGWRRWRCGCGCGGSDSGGGGDRGSDSGSDSGGDRRRRRRHGGRVRLCGEICHLPR